MGVKIVSKVSQQAGICDASKEPLCQSDDCLDDWL